MPGSNGALSLIFESAVVGDLFDCLSCDSQTQCSSVYELFDEDREEFLSPLYTDTYLSKPLMTDAGITRGLLY